jgi:two-component system, cell cycle response regulator
MSLDRMPSDKIPLEWLEEPETGTLIDFEAWSQGVEVPRTGVVVVVDDEPNIARIEAMILQSMGFTVYTALDGEETLALVAQHSPDLVLLDFMMPKMDGLEVLQNIKRDHPSTYVIIVTGKGSEETAVEVMRAGACDYLVKPLPKLPVMRQVIDRTLRLREAELKSQLYVDQLKKLNSDLERRVREKTEELARNNLVLQRMVVRDDLTGLYNQRALYLKLDQEVQRSLRYGRPLGFVMLDVDHFKYVNDQYGHQVGSAMLKQIARVILSSVRSVDWAARFGGDEYCIVLPETDPAGVATAGERIRRNIELYNFRHDGTQLRLTASLGVAVLGPGVDRDLLVKRADNALYRAKGLGRNRVEGLTAG